MKMKFLTTLTLSLMLQCSLAPLMGVEQDYWHAEDYFQNSSSQKNAAADLIKYVEINKNANILDVGCGDGKITAEIALRIPNGSIVGVDISSAMIDFAKQNFPQDKYSNLTFFIKDAQELAYDNQFDIIFSFTTLQWVQSHHAFLKGACQGLLPSGVLALTMPMGLPSTLEQAVTEVISTPQWSSYFRDFSTGWNFVDEVEYGNLLTENGLMTSRLAVVPQKDVFPNREVFKKFVSQWFPYLRPIPQKLKQTFLTQVIDRFLELESQFPNNEVHFKIRRLEAVATKAK
ncbi:MAG: methyltransferase domain-containing protein [Parachlamydiaceae bacterium]|nr:methyltransferase domain-containing protein [Parachlamydiaceae bacterium]